jgi:hypothetical protein
VMKDRHSDLANLGVRVILVMSKCLVENKRRISCHKAKN